MRAAKLVKSKRLQRVLHLLRDRDEHTTRGIIRGAHVCAVNSIVGELRKNGIHIVCRRCRNIWYYRLLP